MPRPTPGEGTQHFVSRYMGSSESRKSFPDQKQRAAVAYSIARQRGLAKSVRHGAKPSKNPNEPEDDPVKFPKSQKRSAPKVSANAVAGSGGGAAGV